MQINSFLAYLCNYSRSTTKNRTKKHDFSPHPALQSNGTDFAVQNPRIDNIEKQVEQEGQLVSRLMEMRGLPYSDCYRRSIACRRRGSHGDAVLRFFKIAINPRFGIKKGTAFAVPFLSLTYEKATPKILPLCYVFIKSARKTRSITRAYSHIISVQNIPQNK